METINAYGLWRYANQYFKAADIIRNNSNVINNELLPVNYYLLCHSIELALKSYLFERGYSKDELISKFRHNLMKCYEQCVKDGIEKLFSLDETEILIISQLNSYYKSKEFEYIVFGSKLLPPVAESLNLAYKIVAKLKPYIRGKQAQYYAEEQRQIINNEEPLANG